MRVVRISYDGFDWDTGNLYKAQKHGVTVQQIEKFFEQELLVLEDVPHSVSEQRRIAVGISAKKRPMFVVFTLRERGGLRLIRVISARFTHKKESELYEKLKKRIQEYG